MSALALGHGGGAPVAEMVAAFKDRRNFLYKALEAIPGVCLEVCGSRSPKHHAGPFGNRCNQLPHLVAGYLSHHMSNNDFSKQIDGGDEPFFLLDPYVQKRETAQSSTDLIEGTVSRWCQAMNAITLHFACIMLDINTHNLHLDACTEHALDHNLDSVADTQEPTGAFYMFPDVSAFFGPNVSVAQFGAVPDVDALCRQAPSRPHTHTRLPTCVLLLCWPPISAIEAKRDQALSMLLCERRMCLSRNFPAWGI